MDVKKILLVSFIFCFIIAGIFIVSEINYGENMNDKDEIYSDDINEDENESSKADKEYEDENESSKVDEESENIVDKKDDKEDIIESININKSSSISNPIKMGETGIIYKKSSSTKQYEKVYINIEKFVKGYEAEQIMKNTESGKIFEKNKEDGMECAVIIYKLDMKDFPTKYETKITMSASIKGKDGRAIKHNGQSYILSCNDITDYEDSVGVQGDKLDRIFAVFIPEGYDEDFLLELSYYDENNDRCEEYYAIENN